MGISVKVSFSQGCPKVCNTQTNIVNVGTAKKNRMGNNTHSFVFCNNSNLVQGELWKPISLAPVEERTCVKVSIATYLISKLP